jgi:hypothetical protein
MRKITRRNTILSFPDPTVVNPTPPTPPPPSSIAPPFTTRQTLQPLYHASTATTPIQRQYTQRSTSRTLYTTQTQQQPPTTTTHTIQTTTTPPPIIIAPPNRRNTYLTPTITNTLHSETHSETHSRFKRSWGGFWGGVFNLATTDDLQNIQQHEMKISEHEMSLGMALQNITNTNNDLFNSLTKITSSVSALTQSEEDLFTEIHTILQHEDNNLQALQTLTKTLDKTTSLTIQYINIQTQTTLLIHSIQKTQSLITASLTNTLDTTQIPTNTLRQFLPQNMQLSMTLVKSQFIYDTSGHSILHKIPQLSSPFTLYYIQTLPIFSKDIWSEVNTSPYIVINTAHEQLSYEKVAALCLLQKSSYICEPDIISIKYTPAQDCQYSLYKSQIEKVSNFSSCKYEKLSKMQSQKQIFKNNYIILASVESDDLNYICPSTQNYVRKISKGINFFTMDRNCRYETKYIHFSNPLYNSPISSYEADLTELSLAESLNSIDTLLEDYSSDSSNYTQLSSLLNEYKGKLDDHDKTITQLKTQIDHVQVINAIKQYSPTNLGFNDLKHSNLYITILFWTVAFIIFIMILTVINKLFPACMCFLIKLPFQLTFELMNQLIAKCRRQTPRPPTNNTRSYIYTQERSPNTQQQD